MLVYKCVKKFYCSPLKRYIAVNAMLRVYEQTYRWELHDSPWSDKNRPVREIVDWSWDDMGKLWSWFTDGAKAAFFEYVGQFPEGGSGGSSIDDSTTSLVTTWSSTKISNELVNNKQDLSEKGQPGGYTPLDENGFVPLENLPPSVAPGYTEVIFNDWTTREIIVGNKLLTRVVIVDYTLETVDGAYFQGGRFNIVHNGVVANFDNEMWGAPDNVPNMVYNADIVGDNIRMILSAEGVGANLKLMYMVTHTVKDSP